MTPAAIMPSAHRAHEMIWEACAYLDGRMIANDPEQMKREAARRLQYLCDHTHTIVAREARKACMRFGIAAPVAVGFTMEGDSA